MNAACRPVTDKAYALLPVASQGLVQSYHMRPDAL